MGTDEVRLVDLVTGQTIMQLVGRPLGKVLGVIDLGNDRVQVDYERYDGELQYLTGHRDDTVYVERRFMVNPEERRFTVNPEPLKVVNVPSCRQCRKRAPWCSCGAMDYA